MARGPVRKQAIQTKKGGHCGEMCDCLAIRLKLLRCGNGSRSSGLVRRGPSESYACGRARSLAPLYWDCWEDQSGFERRKCEGRTVVLELEPAAAVFRYCSILRWKKERQLGENAYGHDERVETGGRWNS